MKTGSVVFLNDKPGASFLLPGISARIARCGLGRQREITLRLVFLQCGHHLRRYFRANFRKRPGQRLLEFQNRNKRSPTFLSRLSAASGLKNNEAVFLVRRSRFSSGQVTGMEMNGALRFPRME